jgi:uncharacterized protein Veg
VIVLTDTISAIREQVSQYRGYRVFYRAVNGRRKAEARQGIIMEAYPSLFTLFVESQNSTVSFSYADLLTKEVELKLLSSAPGDDNAN